jgi:hypothetical protein
MIALQRSYERRMLRATPRGQFGNALNSCSSAVRLPIALSLQPCRGVVTRQSGAPRLNYRMDVGIATSRPLQHRAPLLMTYRLSWLAPCSYDVLLNGIIIASLVRSGPGENTTWTVEPLADLPPSERPAPFTEQEHTFASLMDAQQRLGVLEARENRTIAHGWLFPWHRHPSDTALGHETLTKLLQRSGRRYQDDRSRTAR